MESKLVLFQEIILDSNMYYGYSENIRHDVKEFELGDYIIYFEGNATWRAEVVEKVEGGYKVRDF